MSGTTPELTDARSLLRAEGPRAALERLKPAVRKAPRDPKLRVFLFQLFCIFAEWDRALTQLTVASELDPLALPMAQAYRAAIRCEMLRERVFKGQRTATVLGDPAQWMSLLIEANKMLAAGSPAQAAELRDAAFEQAPASSGEIDGKPFEWIADADQRLGPVLEAFVDGKYYWVPFARLARVAIEAPADLRDQVWMPAHFTWANGGEAHGFIPTRYPGSAEAAEDLATSARTEWREAGDDVGNWQLGLGQRMFATDADEAAVMDLRKLIVTPDPATAPAPDLATVPAPDSATAPRAGFGDRPRAGFGDRLIMAELASRERLQPSLLDRLTDNAPEQKRESHDQQTLNMTQLRQAVLRDLAWLLNTTNLAATDDLEAAPRAAASVVNYGIPGLAGVTAGSRKAARFETAIADAIRRFEPRIRPDSLKVRVRSNKERRSAAKLIFDIEGELWAQPLPQQLFLETSVDIETRLAVVTDRRLGR